MIEEEDKQLKIEDRDIKEVKVSSKEVESKSFMLGPEDPRPLTSGADYVKVFIDNECKLCTFIFFQKHPVVRLSEKDDNMIHDGVKHEAIAQYKVPFETAFTLGIYMNKAFQEIRTDNTIRTLFGPTETTLR
jgi:hypothetical protein